MAKKKVMEANEKYYFDKYTSLLEATAEMYINDHELPDGWWDEVQNWIYITRENGLANI